MNYFPYAGYWFYGASTSKERASFYCSWGLFGDAPTYTPPSGGKRSALRFLLYQRLKGGLM